MQRGARESMCALSMSTWQGPGLCVSRPNCMGPTGAWLLWG